MRRGLFHLVALVSLLLALATSALWLRSYHYQDGIEATRWHRYSALSDRGGILISRKTYYLWFSSTPIGTSERWSVRRLRWPASPDFDWSDSAILDRWGWVHTPGYSIGRGLIGNGPGAYRGRGLRLPHWVYVALFAVVPAWWLAAQVRRRRGRANLCRACRYDLRGSIGKACPECGAEIRIESG